MLTNARAFTAHFTYVITMQRKNDVSPSLNGVRQWSLEGKQVSLHNLNARTLLMFKFHRFIIPAKFYRIWSLAAKGT